MLDTSVDDISVADINTISEDDIFVNSEFGNMGQIPEYVLALWKRGW